LNFTRASSKNNLRSSSKIILQASSLSSLPPFPHYTHGITNIASGLVIAHALITPERKLSW